MSDTWEEALDSLAKSVQDGDAGGWEVDLVRRRVHDIIDRTNSNTEQIIADLKFVREQRDVLAEKVGWLRGSIRRILEGSYDA